MYYRTNLTMRPLLAIEPVTRPADAVERLWIVDGTLIPVRDRKVGAYINTGLVVPHRRVRARVEHAFARMKRYKVLRDCRQRGEGLHHAVQAVAPPCTTSPSPHDRNGAEPGPDLPRHHLVQFRALHQRQPWSSGSADDRPDKAQVVTIPVTRLIVVARMLAPKTYDSRQCRRTIARNVDVETFVSETW